MLLLITEATQRSDAVSAAAKQKAEDAEKARQLAIEQQRQHEEAAAKVVDEERVQRREKIFSGERALLTMAADWRTEAENGKMEESENKIALLLSNLTDLLATCITQQEDIHNLDDTLAQDGVQLQQTATQQLEQRICTAANHSSSEPRETTPKFDGQEIFCDSTKMDPIPWFRKFELTLHLHYVSEPKHHTYLYSRLGGACQAWLDNLLSKYGVVVADLHTKISWGDLKAAWHKRFQVEPPEIKAMDKLMVFEQGTLPSVDWIAEYQRLTSVPYIQMGFKAIKRYLISTSCPTLDNALTHVEDTLATPAELFDKATHIIVTNKEAKNLQRSSAPGLSRDQHRPKVVVVVAVTPNDQTSEAVSANEGDRLAATREGGRPSKGRGCGKAKTKTTSSPRPGAAAPTPWSHYGLSKQAYKARTRFRYCLWCNSDLHDTMACQSKGKAFEDCAARLVPTLGTLAQGQDVCATSSPSGSDDLSFSSGSSRDSAREFNIEVLDPLTSEDFAWLPLPTTSRLQGPQCATLCAHLHTYLSFYAPPTSSTDDEVAVGDILAYVTKVAHKFRNQRYDDNNTTLLYVRIQVGQASCSALLESGASHNFMRQTFMQKAGLGAQVRRKANPTAIKLADGRTQQLIDRYIEAVPVYFAPHACEPVTFDIWDTDFDIILGMPRLASADHTVNFHRQTLTVRNALGAEFDFFPDHIPGKSNRFADALSRRSDHCTAIYSTFEIDNDLRDSFIRGYQADPEFRDKYANCSSPNPAPSHYQIQEGYLLVHTRGKDLLCILSDPHLRIRLLDEFHDAPATGHFGVNHTTGRLRERFWWPGLLGDVTRYCESREVCRRCKSRNHHPYGELRPLPVPLRRREAIAMDITGPFPKHKTGVDGILTVVDRFNKFTMFLPCRYHAKAPELAEVLYAGWIRTKGYPKEIVCDRDTWFMCAFWSALIKRWSSSLKPSSARHPQTDGKTERAH
ncbi:hypothetical protein CBR_g23551 [Chara braunii]|uniref:Integrase catalytic domain-containing protein n=1 Tax=Chara braunii TaxID=69332 RepID=A0A388L4J4_CHABU|nr:hypothetical protein CBR_g23551 [Chara braunii]|eukprot:GBG77224.1 hypothetical protein CBR_g23551 [Chara braunii]